MKKRFQFKNVNREFYLSALNHLICLKVLQEQLLIIDAQRKKIFCYINRTNKASLLYYNRKVNLTQGRKLAIRNDFINPAMTICVFYLDKS